MKLGKIELFCLLKVVLLLSPKQFDRAAHEVFVMREMVANSSQSKQLRRI